MYVLQTFRTQLIFLKTIEKNTLMSIVVCVRYVLNDIFVQINILRCAYILTFFIMYMFAWVWNMHQNVHAYVHMLGHQNIVMYTYKRTYVHTHGCVYACVYLHFSICICEDLEMLKQT